MGIVGVYYAAIALVYWVLPETTLDVWLYLYGLSMGTEYHRIIAVAMGSLAIIHFCYLAWVLVWSLIKRRFVFAIYDIVPPTASSQLRVQKRLPHYIGNIYRVMTSSIAVFSVDSPYFDVVLIFQEIVETSLQTQQAYRMSVLLPRTQLNRCYIALLVFNCWSTALIHSKFHQITTKRRFYVIVCDIVLDLVTSVGISTVILLIYSNDFNFEQGEFPSDKWYNNAWLVHVLSEFQIVLVTSWGDLMMRIIFALSMLGNMDNMKKLLISTIKKQYRTHKTQRITSVMPEHRAKVKEMSHLQILAESRLVQVLFILWGTILLILHLSAESVSNVPDCAMQVKPWGTSVPGCSLFVVDCHALEISGIGDQISTQWNTFDRATTSGLVIRHCTNLEMPDMLTEFSRLQLLKLYNSTITNWDHSAALSGRYHLNLVMLFLVRVNMTDGELPVGLQGNDFPKSLLDIEFCVTNLRGLPDDLDLKWPQSGTIYFEASNLTTVPLPLVSLSPSVLSLALSPISDIPGPLFSTSDLYLHVGSTLISDLPQIVDISPLFKMRVDHTNISSFWDWVDPMIANDGLVYNSLPTILATGTPYCLELQQILFEKRSNFSVPWCQGQSRSLFDVSPENLEKLKKAVSCEAWPLTLYPIEFDDIYSRIRNDA